MSSDLDEFEVKRVKPLIWRTLKQYQNYTNDLTLECRNSVQGKVLIVDEHGFLCYRSDLLFTGCCNIEAEGTKLHSCKTCNVHQCCTIYENCVSCCLNPNKVRHIVR